MVMKASSVAWKPTDKGKKSLSNNVGKNRTVLVGASAQGFNGSEHVGRAGGTFRGGITKTSTGYTARGTFTPGTDTYDYNTDSSRGGPANAATAFGVFSGMLANQATFGIIKPTSYDIEFEGSAEVEWSW